MGGGDLRGCRLTIAYSKMSGNVRLIECLLSYAEFNKLLENSIDLV